MIDNGNSGEQRGAGAGVFAALRELISNLSVDAAAPYPAEVQQAAALARRLQERATALQTPQERRQQAELDRMIQNPEDRITLTRMTDQAFRATSPRRAADQLVHILDVQGIPRFFTPVDRALLKGFQSFGSYLPGVSVPLVKAHMQQETANVILPAEPDLLQEHLQNRREQGVRMNVNILGEALLGEEDAQNRLRGYLQSLQRPEIEVISVKISTIFSQITSIARDESLQTLCERLELLYRAAAKATFTRSDGTVVPKFVYLDMEEYRDMWLTTDAFTQTLDRDGLQDVSAGIVLQGYIPDSFATQRHLTEWAKKRVAAGGAPITLRIVKGANMEMERFESSLHGWPQAPFQNKLETDANYRRMVEFGMQPENLAAVRLGIASHNLFELAYGLVLLSQQDSQQDDDVVSKVQFEMLEGMANHQRRALFELCDNLLLYAPACKKEDFIHAIGYLVRRLDENTGPDNFLRHAFRLEVDSDDWQRLEQQFYQAFELAKDLSDQPRRTQDRHQPPTQPAACEVASDWSTFENESDTDFALKQNHEWAKEIIAEWIERYSDGETDNAIEIPLEIAGQAVTAERRQRDALDPSRPGHVVARYRQANAEDIQTAVACAASDPDGWRDKSYDDRRSALRDVAQRMREKRGDLIGAAMADGGKTFPQSDPEVSEAIDFLEFYSATASYFADLPGINARGRGVVVVVSPWNFPIAIPCGGVAAALAAGNTVILKPASDTVLCAYEMCKCFWEAGVSNKTLQFVPCSGATEGQQLVAHDDVDTVILTGGTETAFTMLDHKPATRLLAETGGKNATIATAMADRDQAIKNVIYSAFGHSGQKCSATSLLILEEEVFNDASFKQTLCDAVASMPVGSAWDLTTKIGPMIKPPSGELEKSLKELEPGESWAVMPRRVGGNDHLWSPAVKWGVQPGSFTHLTEFFGPVLGVMKARDIYEAIDLTNATGYGLTSGLESLDDREQMVWRDGIRAGNLYLNRGTTGAIVLRQPFGGMGKSAFGPGIKAGGPNYVAQLMHFDDVLPYGSASTMSDENLIEFVTQMKAASREIVPAELRERITEALASYDEFFQTEFSREHDHLRLVGQDNFRRYLPVRELRVRVHPDDSSFEIIARIAAAKTAGNRITVSFPEESDFAKWLDEATLSWAAAIEFVFESDDELAEVIRTGHTHRIRYASADRVPESVRRAAASTGLYLADAPVMTHGRIELLWYFEEQSISDNYHRYGNLGARAHEERKPVA